MCVKNASWPFFDSGVGAERAAVAGSKNGLLLRVAKATCVHWQGLSPVRVQSPQLRVYGRFRKAENSVG